MSKWTPLKEEKPEEVKSLPIWVHLRNVPMDMFSWKGLSFVPSAVGVPVRLHQDTAQCKDFKLAKVFVNADLSRELPKEMKFTSLEGKESLVQYSYPWLPTRCSTCNKWGHMATVCLMKTSNKAGNVSISPVKETPAIAETSLIVSEKVADTRQERDLLETDKESMSNEEKEEGEWTTPTKTGRSPDPKKVNLEFGQVSILSHSRFAALSEPEEEEEREGKKTEEEKDLSEESGITSKQNEKINELQPQVDNRKGRKNSTRQTLPRISKENHKFLSDPDTHKALDDNPSGVNKKATRRTN